MTNRAEKTVVTTVRVGERWRFDEADWTIIGCVRGIVDLKREGEPVPSLYLLEDLLREGERLSEASTKTRGGASDHRNFAIHSKS